MTYFVNDNDKDNNNELGISFTTYSIEEIEFLNSCIEGVLICGLFKRYKTIDIDIKPTVRKLITNGLIYKKDNVLYITKRGNYFLTRNKIK